MKIQSLIAIPIALFGVKWLQEQVTDVKPEDIKPLIPTTEENNEAEEVRKRIEGGVFGL